jgi:hypothetical protein
MIFKEDSLTLPIAAILNKALTESRITHHEWEQILAHATEEGEVVLNGENGTLSRLVILLEGGVVTVEGVPQREVLRRLSVFA